MARFPLSKSIPFRIYHLDLHEEARPVDAPLAALHEYLGTQEGEGCANGILFRSRVPPSLDFAKADLWGWCFLDDENPVNVGPWLMWGCRGWTKKVPTRLLAAVVDERGKAWAKENGRETAPPGVRRELKESVTVELLAKMPPEVGEVAVLVDVQRRRLLLPGVSESQAATVTKRLMPVLRSIIHPEVRVSEWELKEYLHETRPVTALPSEIGDRWLAFLTEKANTESWAVFRDVPEHDEPVVFQLVLDGKVQIATDETDFIRAEGAEAVKDALRWVGEEARVRVREVSLVIVEPSPSTRSFEVRLDNDGTVKACKVVGGEDWGDGDFDAACFERAETMSEVATYIRLLMHAFDAGPLEELITEARQSQLWPGSVAPKVEWYEDMPSPAELGVVAPILGAPSALERRREAVYSGSDARAGAAAFMRALGPDTKVTISTTSGSVTVTAADARKAAKKLREAGKKAGSAT